MMRINKLALFLPLLIPFGFVSIAHASSDVVSQTPVNGALGVTTTSAITVVFDRNISVTSANISFSPSVSFTFATSSDTLTITPSAPLASNTLYTLMLSGIQDGNGNVLSAYTSQFTTENSYSIPLYDNATSGLNLVSLPVNPTNTAIATVLGSAASSIDSVWSYDPSNPSADSSGWLVYYPAHPELSSLTTMQTGYGYWIKANSNTTLAGSGSLFTAGNATPPSRSLLAGWNLVGYYQLPGQANSTATNAFSSLPSYTTLVGYDNATGAFKTVSTINPGDAFWIGMPAVSTYLPSYSASSSGGGGTFGAPSSISVSKDPASASNAVSVGASSVELATFDMLASGEPTKVMDLYPCVNTSWGGGLQNGKIYLNGVQVGSTKNLVECTSASGSTDFSLGSSLILPASQTVQVSIYADMRTSTTTLPNGTTITAELAPATSNAQGQNSLSSANVPDTTSANGNQLIVTTSSLSATKATGYGDQGVVAGTNAFKIGSFVLQSGATEGLSVNSIGIDLKATSTIQNLKLMDESTQSQIGTTIASPSKDETTYGAVNTFSTNFSLGESSTKTIDVYADVPSSAQTGAIIIAAVDTTATNATGAVTGTTATISGSDVPLQTITVGSGSLAVALGAGNPVAANVVAGASSIEVGDYTFSANVSSYTVTKLELTMPAASSTAVSNVSLQYNDVNGTPQKASAALTSNGTTATATFSGLTFYVPANNSADVSVYVATPTITTGATTISGTKIAFTLVGTDGTNVQVKDASGNVTYSINGGSNINSNTTGYGFLVLRKSVPTFAGQSSSSTVAPNTSTVLYQFTVSADPAGAVDFNQFSFSVSTSSSVTLKNFYLYDAASPSIALNGTAANADANGLLAISLGSNITQIPAGGSKTFILKASSGTFPSSSSMSINLAPASTSLLTNDQTSNISGNYVWTDRSANSDSTTATQWTNGYLLRDLTDGTYSFTTSS